MNTVIAFAAALILAATPVTPPATPVVGPELEIEPITVAALNPPNCVVTCWSNGQTHSDWWKTIEDCGAFGDRRCGVCNWDGVYKGSFFANC
ncbi:MAG: hypothetical protein SF066_08855 [Thermoanaerobaculia bacterium]|nr:hypothetical protein [Thermoanaerobaculia bacterium]